MRYFVRSLDVWGNEKDGYEVNDSYTCGSITVNEEPSDYDIIQALLTNGLLIEHPVSEYLKQVTIEGDDMLITIDLNGKPLFNLERE